MKPFKYDLLVKSPSFIGIPKKRVKKTGRTRSVSAIKNSLDSWFSKYIRIRDSTNGYGNCCTCGQVGNIKDMDCGHFMSRRHYSTRWEEKNCHLQCVSCNKYRAGEQYKMSIFIKNKYGDKVPEELHLKSRLPFKINRFYLEEQEAKFKKLVKENHNNIW